MTIAPVPCGTIGADEFGQRDHGAFDVEMAIDQTRREVGAVEIDDFVCLVIAEADDPPVVDGDVRRRESRR